MYIVQPPLLDFNDFFALDESDRLVLVLKTINAEPLIRVLQGDDGVGPTGFHARVLWSAMIAGVVYRIPSIAELRRNLASNPYLRFVCGMSSAAHVPSESTFSRFLTRLLKHEYLLDQCFDDLVKRFAVLAPGFGEEVIADSTDIHAYARFRKRGSADPDATWGAKSSKEASSKRGTKRNAPRQTGQEAQDGKKGKAKDKYWWFGYKLHLLVDARYGLVVKLDMRDDPRRYVPVPRETKKFERLYKRRTGVERVNSRLKENLLLDELRVRGTKKVKARVGLNLVVMLAIAVAMAERNRLGDCRRIITCAA